MAGVKSEPVDSQTTECRHEWQCDGWTVDPRTSTCRVCGKQFVFWSQPDSGWDFLKDETNA